MQHDAFFFIGVFVFIFLIWIATGGPTHPLAFSGPTLSQPQELGGGTYLSLPRAPFAVGGSNISLPGSSDGSSSYNPYAPNSGSTSGPTLSGVAFGPPSPYRGIVSLGGYISGAASTPDNESLQIRIAASTNGPVDISGWTLESEATGKAIAIPKGTEVPMNGTINAVQDIVLLPGQSALVVSGRSPIGASFRENKCIGYFSQFQKFSPSLPQNCPAPSDELSSGYSGSYVRDAACIDYVNRLSRCQAVLSPPASVSGSCQAFLVKYLNYNGCVDAHKDDANFGGDTWRIYLGRTDTMWRTTHEVVKLLDATGKTVDAFSY